MTRKTTVENLLNQILALPDETQSEIVQALIEVRAEDCGVYHLDADEHAALARSAEDVRLGRFASDEAIEDTFAR
jgi:hypothetical protein